MGSCNIKFAEIEEDILIVGGGLIGGFLAHALSTKFNYSIRIIEKYNDFSDIQDQHFDRSGFVGVNFRALKLFREYGLEKQYTKLLKSLQKMGLMVQDQVLEAPWIGGQNVQASVVSRNELNSMIIKQNKQNPKIVYEFDTKILNINVQNNTIETQYKTHTQQTRKFKFILGTDGYNSQAREAIDTQLKIEQNLPLSTPLTKIEDTPLHCKNIYLSNKPTLLKQLQEVKNGKYPYYDKLDQKFKPQHKQLQENNQGDYALDPSVFRASGAKNLHILLAPSSHGKGNIVVGIPPKKDSLQKFQSLHPELKNNWRFDAQANINHEELDTDEKIHEFLATNMPFLYGYVPDMVEQWKTNPLFRSQTVFCDNWYYQSQICLLGDSCSGQSWLSANGFNLSCENLGKFLETLSLYIKQDPSILLTNENIRQEIFQSYQNQCLKDTRTCQEYDIKDATFPGLCYAAHPKFMLYGFVEQMLSQQCAGIYCGKLSMTHMIEDSYYNLQLKSKIFQDYICDKIVQAEKPEDIDLSNCKQELIDLCKQHNLNPYYTIAKDSFAY